MAILPENVSFEEFTAYVLERRKAVPLAELQELYDRRARLKSVSVNNGQGLRSILPADEKNLTIRERERKLVAEAKAAGRSIEKLPEKATW
jgi:hypothetical protein|tara:strand:+ start:1286 stop:1558 length:273 start_codon:yes stop_codon:yes gene_type:complete